MAIDNRDLSTARVRSRSVVLFPRLAAIRECHENLKRCVVVASVADDRDFLFYRVST